MWGSWSGAGRISFIWCKELLLPSNFCNPCGRGGVLVYCSCHFKIKTTFILLEADAEFFSFRVAARSCSFVVFLDGFGLLHHDVVCGAHLSVSICRVDIFESLLDFDDKFAVFTL